MGSGSLAVHRVGACWPKTRALRGRFAFNDLPFQRVARAVRWKQRFENGVLVRKNQPLGLRECQQCVFVQALSPSVEEAMHVPAASRVAER